MAWGLVIIVGGPEPQDAAVLPGDGCFEVGESGVGGDGWWPRRWSAQVTALGVMWQGAGGMEEVSGGPAGVAWR